MPSVGRFHGVGNLVSWNEWKVSVAVSNSLVWFWGWAVTSDESRLRCWHSSAVTCFMLGFQPRRRDGLQSIHHSGKGTAARLQRICFPSTACSLTESPVISCNMVLCGAALQWDLPALLFLHTDGMEWHLLPLVLSRHLSEAWVWFSLRRKQLTDYPNFFKRAAFFFFFK